MLLNVTLYIFRMLGSTYMPYIFPYGRFYLPSHCLEPTALDQCESARTLFILPLALSLFLPNGGVTLTLGVRVVKPLSSSPARSRMMRGSPLREAVMTGRPPQIGLARPRKCPRCGAPFIRIQSKQLDSYSDFIKCSENIKVYTMFFKIKF
jgi:hypothetical protein